MPSHSASLTLLALRSVVQRYASENKMADDKRWLFMALLAVAIVALAGCAASGPNMWAEPCGGFYMCAGWH
jgi:hypothetical protein